jgi:endonuclease YncB( thermonuclease family)
MSAFSMIESILAKNGNSSVQPWANKIQEVRSSLNKKENQSENDMKPQKKDVSNCYVLFANDGDTFTAMYNNNKTVFRLSDVDAPELEANEPFAKESKEYLASLIAKKVVFIDIKGKDKYDRLVVNVFLDKEKTKNVQDLMILQGLAYSERYKTIDNKLTQSDDQHRDDEILEDIAEKNNAGVWSQPIHPKRPIV